MFTPILSHISSLIRKAVSCCFTLEVTRVKKKKDGVLGSVNDTVF